MKKLAFLFVVLFASIALAADGALPEAPVDTTKIVAIAGVIWAIASEVLSLLPKVAANGVVQLIMNLIGVIAGKKDKI